MVIMKKVMQKMPMTIVTVIMKMKNMNVLSKMIITYDRCVSRQ